MSFPILEKTLMQHRTKLSPHQNVQITKVFNQGLLTLAESTINKHFPTLATDTAFVIVETKNNNRLTKSAFKMQKNTISSLVKKGVLKQIELFVGSNVVRAWIVNGVGLSVNQFGDSWLKIDGIDPNADREMQRNRRNEILNNIKKFILMKKQK